MLYSLCVTCFSVLARVLARVLITKEKTLRGIRDTDYFFPHPCATELLSSPWHPLSDLATQPIRRPDRTPLARLGPLAPCATEPLTGDLDSVGSVDFLFPCFLCCHFGSFLFSLCFVLPLWQLLVFPCFLCCYFGSFLFSLCFVLPLWQLLVFLVSCFLCCYFGSCFVCLFR